MSNRIVIWADDGSRWVYAPELDIWSGWVPSDNGLWELSWAEMERHYPEVCRRYYEGHNWKV